MRVLKLLQGKAYSNTKQALLGAFDEDGDGKMSFKEFVTLDEKFPQMLFVSNVQDYSFLYSNNALTTPIRIHLVHSQHLDFKTQSPSIR